MADNHPRRSMRARERRTLERRLAAHAEFMRQIEAEGWEREAASTEALRMLKAIEAAKRKTIC
jgi:hypothetical protein